MKYNAQHMQTNISLKKSNQIANNSNISPQSSTAQLPEYVRFPFNNYQQRPLCILDIDCTIE